MPEPARGPLLLALIPAHDEAARIRPVVAAAITALPVVVVDDGSSDDTAAIAGQAGAAVILQRPNQGKGAALRTGFRHALEAGADGVVTLDADGQHDPSEIPRLIEAWDSHGHARGAAPGHPDRATTAARSESSERPELVIGRRSFAAMPPARRISNSLGTLVLSALLGRWIPDNQSGYRVIGRRLMTAMLDSRDDGFAFEVEMIAVCLREGWSIGWVPIRTIYGEERSHIRPLRHLREFLAVSGRARAISRQPPRFRPAPAPMPASASEPDPPA